MPQRQPYPARIIIDWCRHKLPSYRPTWPNANGVTTPTVCLKGPIHDQSCCAKMFCATQVCPFTINHVAQRCFVQQKFAHSRSIMSRKYVLCNTSLPIHDQSCRAKMFCPTQVCTKYDSIHVATWLHNFSWVLRAIVFASHIRVLNMTSEACLAIILALECSPEKAKKRKRKQYWMKEWFKKRVTF
jgi:hypothetical protein